MATFTGWLCDKASCQDSFPHFIIFDMDVDAGLSEALDFSAFEAQLNSVFCTDHQDAPVSYEAFVSHFDPQYKLDKTLKIPNWLNIHINEVLATYEKHWKELFSVKEMLSRDLEAYKEGKPPKALNLSGSRVQYKKDDDMASFRDQQKKSDFEKAMSDLRRRIDANKVRFDKLRAMTEPATFLKRVLGDLNHMYLSRTKYVSQEVMARTRDHTYVLVFNKAVAIYQNLAAKEETPCRQEEQVTG